MKVQELVGKTVNVNWNMETASGGNKFAGGVPWVNLLVKEVRKLASGWFVILDKGDCPVDTSRLSLSDGTSLELEYPEEVLDKSLPFHMQREWLMYKAESEGMNPTDKSLYPDFAFRYLKNHYPDLVSFWNLLRPQLKKSYGEEVYSKSFEPQDMFSLMVVNDVKKAKEYFSSCELLKGKLHF